MLLRLMDIVEIYDIKKALIKSRPLIIPIEGNIVRFIQYPKVFQLS
jgi:hypothetical protein